MKTFITWLVVHVIVFAASGIGVHSYLAANPKQVLIAVDTSQPMKEDWTKAMDVIESMHSYTRYRQFAVITDKSRIHSWQEKPDQPQQLVYGPRQLSDVINKVRYPEIEQSDERILITNETGELAEFSNWRIVKP